MKTQLGGSITGTKRGEVALRGSNSPYNEKGKEREKEDIRPNVKVNQEGEADPEKKRLRGGERTKSTFGPKADEKKKKKTEERKRDL